MGTWTLRAPIKAQQIIDHPSPKQPIHDFMPIDDGGVMTPDVMPHISRGRRRYPYPAPAATPITTIANTPDPNVVAVPVATADISTGPFGMSWTTLLLVGAGAYLLLKGK